MVSFLRHDHIIHSVKLNFANFIFADRTDHENVMAAKISMYTKLGQLLTLPDVILADSTSVIGPRFHVVNNDT